MSGKVQWYCGHVNAGTRRGKRLVCDEDLGITNMGGRETYLSRVCGCPYRKGDKVPESVLAARRKEGK